jgi:hypothetical protein
VWKLFFHSVENGRLFSPGHGKRDWPVCLAYNYNRDSGKGRPIRAAALVCLAYNYNRDKGGGAGSRGAGGSLFFDQLVFDVVREGGEGEAVEGGVDVGADEGPRLEAGIGVQERAVAVEEEAGGDGAEGGESAKSGDDGGIGVAEGEDGAERAGFGGDFGGGTIVGDDADDGESAVGEFGVQGVPVGDGAAAGGVVGAEEHDPLDLPGVIGGADFAGELVGEIAQHEIMDGGRGGRGRGFLAAAGGQEN